MENEDFSQAITSILSEVGALKVYKIFGEETFEFSKAEYPNDVDWSGLYTQLSPGHSLRYLTKKWDDGADKASLLRFRVTNSKIRLLKVIHPSLCSPKIDGEVKARSIKRHICQHYSQFKQIEKEKLLQSLGKQLVLLECVDAEDQEIVIPHEMLKGQNFLFEHIVHFEKSQDGMLRTIRYKMAQEELWTKVAGQYQFQPYKLLQETSFSQKMSTVLAREGKKV